MDSAFCELETDFVASKNVTCRDQFGLLRALDDSCSCYHYWTGNLPKSESCYGDFSPSSKSIDSQSAAESCGSELSNVEEMETSETESLCHNAEWDDSSGVMELSSSSCLSDESTMFSHPDIPCKNAQVSDNDQLSNSSCRANVHVALPLDASSDTVGNESQLAQHQPLVFFIIGLFVGLSLGFFTCKCATDTT